MIVMDIQMSLSRLSHDKAIFRHRACSSRIRHLSMSLVLSSDTSRHRVLSEPPPSSALVINISLSSIRWRSKEGVTTLKRFCKSPCKSVVPHFKMITFSLCQSVLCVDSWLFCSSLSLTNAPCSLLMLVLIKEAILISLIPIWKWKQ